MKWHYYDWRFMYTLVWAFKILLSIRFLLFPLSIVHANPTLPFGGMTIGPKHEILERFKSTHAYLAHCLIQSSWSLKKKTDTALLFAKKIGYPLIAKPDVGSVGRGLKKISNKKELILLLKSVRHNYILQEYCEYPLEYGILFRKLPHEKEPSVISLTRKEIPTVTGDGVSTVKELVSRAFGENKETLLAHAPQLEYVVPKGKQYRVIDQASHTYGAIFHDECHLIDARVNAWVRGILACDQELCYGRFDMKVKSPGDLKTGKHVKIVELNGCMSEPIHMYDEKYPFSYGLSQLFRSYASVFRIARCNKTRLKLKTPIVSIIKEFWVVIRERKTMIAFSKKKL